MDGTSDPERADALEQYKKRLLDTREIEAKLKGLRLDIKGLQKDFDTTEDNIKALQSVGQIIGEVLKQLDEERCKSSWWRLNSLEIFSTDILNSASHRQSFVRSPLCRRL